MKKYIIGLLLLYNLSCNVKNNSMLNNCKYELNYNNKIDTLLIKTNDSFIFDIVGSFYGQTSIGYYVNGKLLEKTFATINDDRFGLHPPRNIIPFSQVPPFPEIGLPPDTSLRYSNDLEIFKYKDFKNGFLEGKTIQQKFRVIRKLDTLINNKNIEVWYSIGYNTNYIKELGKYLIETYFSKQDGFVLIIYTLPDGSKAILKRINYTSFVINDEL